MVNIRQHRETRGATGFIGDGHRAWVEIGIERAFRRGPTFDLGNHRKARCLESTSKASRWRRMGLCCRRQFGQVAGIGGRFRPMRVDDAIQIRGGAVGVAGHPYDSTRLGPLGGSPNLCD